MKKAANLGDGRALLEVGKSVFQDEPADAEPFFAEAAKRAQPGAVFHLSRVAAAAKGDNGVTAEADFLREVELLELCAHKHKDNKCMHLLGLYHAFGVGTLDVNGTKGIRVRSSVHDWHSSRKFCRF